MLYARNTPHHHYGGHATTGELQMFAAKALVTTMWKGGKGFRALAAAVTGVFLEEVSHHTCVYVYLFIRIWWS